ncbi:Hypothetical Protein XCAW_00004 [Xanthomonas citri subsp. citri Aw12879]|nr:Hypothetical Protein XCAW_00004 [Xanthomonas citri subsp. citri Aw12879]
MFLRKIWPYHHHKALKLFIDLKANCDVYNSKTPGNRTRGPWLADMQDSNPVDRV